MKTFQNQAAQGDLLLRRIDTLPPQAEAVKAKAGAYVLAHSETGHNHVVMERPNVTLYQDRANLFRSWLVVSGDEAVKVEHQRSHDTHEAIQIEPGIYEVRRQREYTPEGFRRAAD